jgi:Protein of unknown function (DUF4236)/Protein of unknown function (DUF3761)
MRRTGASTCRGIIMAFRFRTSIRIARGIQLNLSRSGVSTTFGKRGLSVNVGRRGTRLTAGIPGTGISWSALSGASAGGRGRSGGAGAGQGSAGCLGCGGFLVLLLVGFCGSLDIRTTPRLPDTPSVSANTYSPGYSPSQERKTFYLHGSMNVRSGPGATYDRVRTLSRGEQVSLGPKDAGGWAPMFDVYGQRVGYVYRASDNVRTYPPAAESRAPNSGRTHPAGASAVCRDGTYSYSRSRRGTCSHHGGVSRWL